MKRGPKLTLLLLVLLFAFCPVGQAQTGGRGEEQSVYVFQSGRDGYAVFRIPALAVSRQGTLLAFAEGRAGMSDGGNIDIVLKRSLDGGQTWKNTQVVCDNGMNTYGNPAPVVDEASGRIYLLMCHNQGTDSEGAIIAGRSRDTRRVLLCWSDDDGLSWSEPSEITDGTKQPSWTWYATGPGHGIVISRGQYRGRMVVACDHAEKNRYYSHVIYSDDHGQSWHLGGTVPLDGLNECTVAETADGLLLNMRNYDRRRPCRKVSLSQDGGLTWTTPRFASELVDPICQGSSLAYSLNRHPLLLCLNAADQSSRSHLSLSMSRDGGLTWPERIEICAGPSAYSDMARLRTGDVGCLYETGVRSAYEGIAFFRIPKKRIESFISK